MQAQHREVMIRETYGRQLRAAMTTCHGDGKCQADLDRAIAKAAAEVAERDVANVAQLLAQKLTRRQLEAMLKFYGSPDGQAVANAEIAMSDEFAQIGHASSVYAQKSIAKYFCPAHPEICVNDLGRHPTSSPKS